MTLNVKMVSADFLENHLSQRLHISLVDKHGFWIITLEMGNVFNEFL